MNLFIYFRVNLCYNISNKINIKYMFEKMFNKENILPKKNKEESRTKKTLSSLESATKIAAFLMLLSGPLQANSKTVSNEDGPEKNKIEDARMAVKKIISLAEKNDKSDIHTINMTNVKGFEKGDKEIICAEDKSFILVSIEEGGYTYFDANSDGVLDRLVINNEEEEFEGKKKMVNYSYAFSSMDKIFKETPIIADLLPKKIKILSFDSEKTEVSFAEVEQGSFGKVDGDYAKKIIDKFQDNYTQQLQKIISEQE